MKKVSVIMSVYNPSSMDILLKAINSIFSQTFKDFELIICNDGSGKEVKDYLKSLLNCGHSVKIIENTNNLGLAASLNKCIELAEGEYIARMDADDSMDISRFQKQVNFLDTNLEYSMVGTNAELFNDEGIWGKKDLVEKPCANDMLFGPPFIHPSIMIRKAALEEVNGYRVEKETLRAEDYDLWMRLYEKGFKGYNLQERLYFFREDSNAYSRRKYRLRFDEAKVRYKGFKRLGLFPKAIPFVIKPFIVGLIPQSVLSKLRGDHNI